MSVCVCHNRFSLCLPIDTHTHACSLSSVPVSLMDLLSYEPPLSWGPPPPRFYVSTIRREEAEKEDAEAEEEETRSLREVATALLSLAKR